MSFASKERQREIASSGGKAVHALGRAHKWEKGDPRAKEAGLKGGLAYKARMEKRKQAKISYEYALIHNPDAKLTLEEVAEFGWSANREAIESERRRRVEAAKSVEAFRKAPLAVTNEAATHAHVLED